MPGRLFFFFFFFPAFVFAQNQYRFLLHKTYAQRFVGIDTAFIDGDCVAQDSTAYFKRVTDLEKLAEIENDKELALEARFIRANYDMVGHQYNRPRFLKAILELKEIADARGLLSLQIRVRQTLGYYYFHIAHQYGPGFENYLGAYNLLKNMPLAEFPNKQQYIAEIGAAYYQFGDYDIARKILTEAQRIPPSFRYRFTTNMINTLGLIYREKKQFDSAEYFFRKAYNQAAANHDSTWMGITSGNIGISYYLQHKYDKAVPLLELDVRESFKANERDNAVNSLTYLAKISLLKNELTKTTAFIRQMQAALPKTGDPLRHEKEIYLLLAQMNAKTGNYKVAYFYSDSAKTITERLQGRRQVQEQLKAEQKVALEKYNAEVDHIAHHDKLRRLVLYALIIALILISIIVILVINRKRLVLKQQESQLQEEKRQISFELAIAENQLAGFTKNLREKNRLIEQFTEEIKSYQLENKTPELEAHQLALQQLLNASLLTDAQWEQFRVMFDKVHHGFLQRLREKLPMLSPADTRYIVLNKLQMTPKEMAAMLGVRPDAIRLYRHRLRKKLNIPDDKELEELLDAI